MRRLLPLLVLLITAPAVSGQDVDFYRGVRPILAGRCFSCHGPDHPVS